MIKLSKSPGLHKQLFMLAYIGDAVVSLLTLGFCCSGFAFDVAKYSAKQQKKIAREKYNKQVG